jgi:hypothetical protein
MKNSIQFTALLLTIIGLTTTASAQTSNVKTQSGIILSAGVESGISTGSFRDNQKWSIGGSLQADLPVYDQLYVTINAGYRNFFGKNNQADLQLLPMLAGIKYFPVSHFYIQAAAGTGFVLNKSDFNYQKTAAFLYVPQIGVQLPVGGKNYIDAGVRYEGSTKYTSSAANSKVSSIGLRVAYTFSTK